MIFSIKFIFYKNFLPKRMKNTYLKTTYNKVSSLISAFVCALFKAIIRIAEMNCANRDMITILLVFMLAKGL
jgi:hypothetical protein